jgi:integrase
MDGRQRPKSSKRGHQEGNIYQRGSGRWVGRVMLGRRADGKPDRPKVYGRTRGEVQRQLAELRRKAAEGTRAEPSLERQTVAAYLESWLAAARAATRPQTWEGYRQIARSHIIPVTGTVTKIHIVLHRALAMAVRWNYIPRNPANAVDRPAVPRRDRRTLEPAELNRLLACAITEADRPGLTAQQARAARQWRCCGRSRCTRAVVRGNCSAWRGRTWTSIAAR